MPPPVARKIRALPVAFVCAALLLASCHGSSKHASTSTGTPSTDTTGKVAVTLALKLGTRDVQAAGTAHPFPAAQAQAIDDLVNKYIKTAITTPLVTGHPPAALNRFFAPALEPRLRAKTPDRAALADENLPLLTSVTKTVAPALNLTILEDHGPFVMVGAQFALTVQGQTDQGQLTITRAGQLLFQADAQHVWHISGYTVVVRRTLGGTTTSSTATTTTAAP